MSKAQQLDWLGGGGEMGHLLRTIDWSKTPLGPIDGWPQSLKTTVSLALASNFPISIAWGPAHTQIYNDGYWPICGAKHPQSMGQNFSECWASAWPAIGEPFARALAGQTSFLENQRMFLDRNGYLEETFFTFTFSPIRDESGGVGGLFHPVTETTARMLSERRVRVLRDLASRTSKTETVERACALAMTTLAEASLDVPFALLYLLDEKGTARLAGAVGLSRGAPAAPEIVDVGAAAPPWPIADVLQTGRRAIVTDLDARFGPLGCGPYEESPRQAVVFPISSPGQDQPFGVLVGGVSPRRALDDDYLVFHEMLAGAVATAINSARAYEAESRRAEVLAELDRAKTAFFSNVSHEFRTPLTLILGPVEDAVLGADKTLRGHGLETVHRSALRLLRLVNSLLDFSRIEAGRLQMAFEPTDLAALTRDLASSFRSLIERAGVQLHVDCPPLREPVYVDRGQWEKIVLNLLSNAFKFTMAGEIAVSLHAGAQDVALEVRDTGTGIPAAELPKVFERFHRVQGAAGRSFEGTGIGLALVKELVTLHGGSITVASDAGRGSAFTVRVPFGRAHLPAEQIASGREPPPDTGPASPYRLEATQWLPPELDTPVAAAEPSRVALEAASDSVPRRILVVDDNADMRHYLVRLLEQMFVVEPAPDGQAALERARAWQPDLVLTDVMMPRLDGFGLLRELRKDPRTQLIPVIMLSARAGEEAVLEGLEIGADDYLVKPFSARELLTRIRSRFEVMAMRRKTIEQEQALAAHTKMRAELERRVEERTAALASVNKELEAFCHSVSHDLRAPLRGIDGFSKALLREHGDRLDEQGRDYLTRVRRATQRMSGLIDDLLHLSRITRADLKRVPTDVSARAKEVLADLQQRAPERRVEVRVAEGLVASADPGLLSVLLENLIGNAWKFTGKQPCAHIEIGQEEHDGERAFFVHDDGAGFNMQHAGNLFAPFQRLHSQNEFEGTGIGLATVHRIVTRHGGHVWADSRPGDGSTFWFTLGVPSS